MLVYDPRELLLSNTVHAWLINRLEVNPGWLSHILLGMDGPGYRHQLDFEAYLLGLLQGGTLRWWEVGWLKLDPYWIVNHEPGLLPPGIDQEKAIEVPCAHGTRWAAVIRNWYHPNDGVVARTYFAPMPIYDSHSIELFIKGLSVKAWAPSLQDHIGMLEMCCLSQPFTEDQIQRVEALLLGHNAKLTFRLVVGQEWLDAPYPIKDFAVTDTASARPFEWVLDSGNASDSARRSLTKKMPHYRNTFFLSTISSAALIDKLGRKGKGGLNRHWLYRLERRPAILDDPDAVVQHLPLVFDDDWARCATALVRRSDLVRRLRLHVPDSITTLPMVHNLAMS